MSLKFGIIGFGGAGAAQRQYIHDLGGKVTAVFDPKPDRREHAKSFDDSMLVTDDLDQFFDADFDATSICSPDRTHAEYFVRSLATGKHTISEKPLTDSLDGCRDIIRAADESPKLVSAVQHQMRFVPVHAKMKEIVRSGKLGRLSYLEGNYIHNLTERGARNDLWRFEDNATPTVYCGCHFIDLMRWMLDDEVVEVSAMANNLAFPEYPESDMNAVLLRFRSGVIGRVVSAFGFGRPQDHAVRIYGSEKCIENNLLFDKSGKFEIFARPQVREAEKPGTLSQKYRAVRYSLRTIAISRLMERLMKFKGLMKEYPVSSYPLRLYEHGLSVRHSLADFVDAVRTGRKPGCGVIDAAKTVATCLAAVEAYRTNQTVSVEKFWLPEFDETMASQVAAVA